mgnify:CR=1 FL=1|jgi:hypothetical protein|tara:strand:- start:1308 stop:1721 length:414 start_codon:yes stop_codon:yes gene_type:complete
MGYAIELSFDVRKRGSLVLEKQRRRRLAMDYLCSIQYFMHEIEGHGKTTTRNDIVQVVIFETGNLEGFLDFVKAARRDREVHVECIYQDDCTCDLLYASPKYLKRIEKSFAKSYKKKLKTQERSEVESMVMNALMRN